MSTSLSRSMYLKEGMHNNCSAKIYLKMRMHRLNMYKVSDLIEHINMFNQTNHNLVSVGVKIDKKKDDAMILLCYFSPLLTILACNKETIGVDRRLQVISWEPRLFVYHNFLTNEECEHLITLAKPRMAKSKVVDHITGGAKESSYRTSTGASFKRGYDKIVEEIENRISEFTFIPVENGEYLQVLHYGVGQKFEPHFDGLERIATVLMYLSDVDEGGQTAFPTAKGNMSKRGLSILPKKRDAVLFWNMRPNGSRDPSSLHAGCPVIKGSKWVSTKWFHSRGWIQPKKKKVFERFP